MKLKLVKMVKSENEIELKLHKDENVLYLCAYKDGKRMNCGYLLAFHNDGTVDRHWGIDKEIGFDLDEHGRLKML